MTHWKRRPVLPVLVALIAAGALVLLQGEARALTPIQGASVLPLTIEEIRIDGEVVAPPESQERCELVTHNDAADRFDARLFLPDEPPARWLILVRVP